jgi:hypothetical protein
MTQRTWTDAELITAIDFSDNWIGVYRRLGLSKKGFQRGVHHRAAQLNLDWSHFTLLRSLENKLVINSRVKPHSLRSLLFRHGLVKNKCSECGIEEWQDKPITIEVDHINGDPTDNRLENLRMLCPNCHSQTETHRGKQRNGQVT